MAKQIHKNLPVDELVKLSLERKEGEVSKTGALVVNTGKYTGRSPNDKFIVDTPEVHDQIDWGEVNVPMTEEKYNQLDAEGYDVINVVPISMGQSENCKRSDGTYVGDVGFSITRGAVVVGKKRDENE